MNPTILYQLPPNSHCQMMSYVLQTAEGRLVVIDGGCRPDGEALLRFLDILVDGPFVLAQRNLDLLFRGSENQRILDVPKSLAAGRAVWCTAPRWVGEKRG